MSEIYSPHDHTFKRLLDDKRVAEDFFKQYLPEKIRNLVNFEELQVCNNSFIEPEFKSSHADVLYKTFFQDKPGYLYLLIEHQSTADCFMPFRLLKYCVSIMANHHDKNPEDSLPLVYPMVFYHGKENYHAKDLFDLFGEHRELAKEIFLKPFHLIDVTKISDNDLQKHLWSGTLSFVFKHIYVRELWQALEGIKPQIVTIEQHPEGEYYLVTLLEYVFNQTKTEDTQKLVTFIQETLTPSVGEKVMLLRDHLIQQGIKQGIQQGRQEGRQEGLEQGIEKEKRLIAARLLARGEAIEAVAKLTDLKIEEIKALHIAAHES